MHAGVAIDLPATMDAECDRIRALRTAIADRIEADIALLDALDGDPDIEEGGDLELSLCGIGDHAAGGSLPSRDDREDGDDTGIADGPGLRDQQLRHLSRLNSRETADDLPFERIVGRLRVIAGGRA